MKNLAVLLLLLLAVAGCKNRNKTTAEVVESSVETVVSSTGPTGTYTGTRPCADCEGIEITITLDDKGNFTRTMKYLTNREGQSEFTDKGTSKFDAKGNVLTVGDEQYLVSQGALTLLDQDGNRIEGELAELYVLTKKR